MTIRLDDLQGLRTGQRIRIVRDRRGLSRRVLGDLVGMSPYWVKAVESGRLHPPRLPMLVLVAEALRISDVAVLIGTDMNVGAGATIPVPSRVTDLDTALSAAPTTAGPDPQTEIRIMWALIARHPNEARRALAATHPNLTRYLAEKMVEALGANAEIADSVPPADAALFEWYHGEPIAELIRRVRTGRGQSQDSLADSLAQLSGRVTVTRTELNRWEKGKRIPESFWRGYLAKALDIPQDVLDRAAAVSVAHRKGQTQHASQGASA